jgi:glycosyltransferase involved in cell wall biosynthesis
MSTGEQMTTSYALDLTIVVPLYQEEENVDAAVTEVLGVLDDMPHSAELILVDDGSQDATGELALAWAKREPRVRVIQFRRNYGQTAAIQAGFDASHGAVVVLMDGDQQNDPRDIPILLEKMADGYDVVSGWRKNRQDRTLSRKLPSRVANRMISRFTGTELHDYGCTLKAYSADIARELRLYGELHRFIPALAAMAGGRVTELPVNHRPRLRGSSKYGIGRAPRVLLDLITVKFMLRYLTKPMQLFGKWGLIFATLGLIGVLFLVGEKVLGGHALADRPLLLLSCVALICGILLFCVGLLGEVLIRIYYEGGSRRPHYTVRPDVTAEKTVTILDNHVVVAPPVHTPAEP